MLRLSIARLINPVSSTMTCGESRALLKDDRRIGSASILWLDGYYSGRSGLTELPAGWVRTVSQGIGGICAISVNDQRTVLDVIGQLHREYAGRNQRPACDNGRPGVIRSLRLPLLHERVSLPPLGA
jgi:hypothetical protein